MAPANKWLLLLYSLPTKRSAARVSLWRQLKRLGAIPFKTSASLLPDTSHHLERFQWLAQQVRDDGGDATLIRVTEVEGMTHAQIVQLFNAARANDYGELIRELTQLVEKNKKKRQKSFPADLDKMTAWFEEIRQIDFFDCPRAQDAQMLVQRAFGLRGTKRKTATRLSIKEFQGKTWLTRPRPEIDRVGSAWLIRKFIDSKARFIFASDPKKIPEAIPYDMAGVDLSHHGEDCTFETLVKRFGISDKALQKIAEMVHEADLEDGKFQHAECVGIDRILKGWAKLGLSDEQLLQKGGECFDALYRFLSR